MISPQQIDILELTLTYTQELIDDIDLAYAVLYDSADTTIHFPAVKRLSEEQDLQWETCAFRPDQFAPDFLIREEQPILINENPKVWFHNHNLTYRDTHDLPAPKSFLGVPLAARGRALGAIVLEDYRRGGAYDDEDREVLVELAYRAAAELADIQQVDNLKAVTQVGQTLTSRVRFGELEILKLIRERAEPLMDTRNMYIALFNRGTRELRFPLAYENNEKAVYPKRYVNMNNPTQGGLTEHVIRNKKVFNPLDVRAWYYSKKRGGPPVDEEEAPIPQSWLGVPLMAGDEILGVIALQNDDVARLYGPNEIEVLQMMASQAAVALANTQTVQRLKAVNEAGRALSAGINLTEDKILTAIREQATPLMDTRNMYVARFNPDTNLLSFPLAYEDDAPVDYQDREVNLKNKIQGGMTEEVIRRKAAFYPKDVHGWYYAEGRNGPPEKDATIPLSWLGVPLVVNNKVIGVITVQNDDVKRLYKDDDIAVLETLASQAAIALENAKLYKESKKLNENLKDLNASLENRVFARTKQLTALQTISMQINSETNLEEVLEIIADSTNSLFNADFTTLYLFDESQDKFTNVIRRGEYTQIPDLPVVNGYTHNLVTNHESRFIDDVTSANLNPDSWFEDISIASFAGISLISQGHPVGFLYTTFFEHHTFNDEEKEVLMLLANQAAIAIDKADLYEGLENRVHARTEQLGVLQDIILEITRENDLNTILDLIAVGTNQLIGSDFTTVFPYEPKNDIFLDGIRQGSFNTLPTRPRRGGLTDSLLSKNQILFIEDTQAAREESGVDLAFAPQTIKAFAAIPLVAKEQGIGFLYASFYQPHNFSNEDKEILQTLVSHAAVAIDNARLVQNLRDIQNEIADKERTLVRTTMAADFVHRIHNIAGTIGPWVELTTMNLSQESRENPKVTRYLGNIAHDAEQFLKQAQEINQPSTAEKSIDLKELVNTIIGQLEFTTTSEIRFKCERQLPSVIVKEQLLSTAIYNVLHNATKATKLDGQILVEIKESDESPNHIEVIISDTGPGVPEQIMDNIFEFGTSHWPDGSGTGYGLWRAKAIVQSIDGQLSLTSNHPGEGATFTFLLPVTNC